MSNFAFLSDRFRAIADPAADPAAKAENHIMGDPRAACFRARVQSLGHLQTSPELDPDTALRCTLADALHGEVAVMNRNNFIVRMHLEAVRRFQQRDAWDGLGEGDGGAFERHRQRVVAIAMLLEEKTAIPAVAARLEYLGSHLNHIAPW